MEMGYASEEFTSAFEIRENTAKTNQISRVSTAAGGGYPIGIILAYFQSSLVSQQTNVLKDALPTSPNSASSPSQPMS